MKYAKGNGQLTKQSRMASRISQETQKLALPNKATKSV